MIKTKTIVSIVSISALIILVLASIILPCIPVSFAIADAVDLDSNLSATSINLFKSYVSPGLYTVSGLTFTVNYDYSVEVEGTATADVQFMLGNTQGNPNSWGTVQTVNFPVGSYYCSFGSVSTSDVFCQFVFVVNGVNHWVSVDRVFSPTLPITSMTARIFVNSGTVVNKGDFIFKLQFQQGTVATPYQPNLERVYELGQNSMQSTIDELQNKYDDLQSEYQDYIKLFVASDMSPFYGGSGFSVEGLQFAYSDLSVMKYNNQDSYFMSRKTIPTDVNLGGLFRIADITGVHVDLLAGKNISIYFDLLYHTINSDFSRLVAYDYGGSLGIAFFDSDKNFIAPDVNNSLAITSSVYTCVLPKNATYFAIFSNMVPNTFYGIGWKARLYAPTSNNTNGAYELGMQAGIASVNTQKYYDEGYRVGQEIGYANGSKAQGDYTFLGLIGAVIDAPINSFRQMFNFEVLGVNMSSFMLSLLSLALVCVVLRIALGGNK